MSQQAIIRTYTNKLIDLEDIKIEDIDILDIAHSLSLLCRYNGHCSKFYSVAEHSVRATELVTGRNMMVVVLLHDAAEAYVGDVTSPLKQLLNGQYRKIENEILRRIYHWYGIDDYTLFCAKNKCKQIDHALFLAEQRDLYPRKTPKCQPDLVIGKIRPWSSAKAKRKFLEMAKKLNIT